MNATTRNLWSTQNLAQIGWLKNKIAAHFEMDTLKSVQRLQWRASNSRSRWFKKSEDNFVRINASSVGDVHGVAYDGLRGAQHLRVRKGSPVGLGLRHHVAHGVQGDRAGRC